MGVLPQRGSTTATTNRSNNPYIITDIQGFDPADQYAGLAEYDVTIEIPGVSNSAITIKKISLYETRNGDRGISFFANKKFEKDPETGRAAIDPETGKTKKPINEYTIDVPDALRVAIKDLVLAHYAAAEQGLDGSDADTEEVSEQLYDPDGNPIEDPFTE